MLSRRRRVLLYTLYSVVVICLGTVIVLSFTKSSTTSPTKTATSTTKSINQSQKNNQKSSTVSTSKNGASKSSQSLNNSGPGNVVGIFIATTIVFTFLHRYWQQKLEKS